MARIGVNPIGWTFLWSSYSFTAGDPCHRATVLFKTYHTVSIKTTLITTVIAVLVLAFVFKFLFPFTLKFFSASELFFVNSVGLPYNSGSIIAGIILILAFYFGLKNYPEKSNWLQQIHSSYRFLFIMIGFSSWLMLPIRGNANTAINENNPSSARELGVLQRTIWRC